MIREDISLTALMLGLYLCYFQKDLRHGLFVVIVSTSYFLIVTQWLMPILNTGNNISHLNFANYFANLHEPVEFILRNVQNKYDMHCLPNERIKDSILFFLMILGPRWKSQHCYA